MTRTRTLSLYVPAVFDRATWFAVAVIAARLLSEIVNTGIV